jgi:uncharacterized protein (UPF0333 family)
MTSELTCLILFIAIILMCVNAFVMPKVKSYEDEMNNICVEQYDNAANIFNQVAELFDN